MSDASREGVGWAMAALLFSIGAAASQHPLPKLFCSLGAIGAGTKAIDCFNSTANAAYQQLIAPKEHRQLPLHAH